MWKRNEGKKGRKRGKGTNAVASWVSRGKGEGQRQVGAKMGEGLVLVGLEEEGLRQDGTHPAHVCVLWET